jgi:hypothetical protein
LRGSDRFFILCTKRLERRRAVSRELRLNSQFLGIRFPGVVRPLTDVMEHPRAVAA